jgi:hypothetical protein
MTTAPDAPPAPDQPEPAEPPDPAHEPEKEPRFAPEGDDTPEMPMPEPEESGS